MFIGGALALFAHRAPALKLGGLFAPLSREGSLVLNNVLLTTATATVLIGTLYPLALDAFSGARISVGPPYFNMTFGPLMIPLLLALPFGPALAWKRGDLAAATQRLLAAAAVRPGRRRPGDGDVACADLGSHPFGIALGVWVVAGAVADFVFRVKLGAAPLAESGRRLIESSARGLGRHHRPRRRRHHGDRHCCHHGLADREDPRHAPRRARRHRRLRSHLIAASFPIRAPTGASSRRSCRYRATGKPSPSSLPSKRIYDAPPQATSEAGIYGAWSGDLYAVLGDETPDGGRVVRLYFNPLVKWIWLGAVIMALGGGLSLSDRRLRVGAPRKARAAAAPAPAE